MRVFISWSGARSRAVAELLRNWLQCVIQAVQPWISSKDIDRGSLWFSEISDQLKATSVGIVCLTKENLNKPWILFEAGALAKGLSSSRVCTFLVDLDSTDVKPPLAQFNHTFPKKEEMHSLVRTVNASLSEQHQLRDDILDKAFDTYWPQFDKDFQSILAEHPEAAKEPKRSEDDILAEILRTVRTLDRRIRAVEGDQRQDLLSFFGTPSRDLHHTLSYDDFKKKLEDMTAQLKREVQDPVFRRELERALHMRRNSNDDDDGKC